MRRAVLVLMLAACATVIAVVASADSTGTWVEIHRVERGVVFVEDAESFDAAKDSIKQDPWRHWSPRSVVYDEWHISPYVPPEIPPEDTTEVIDSTFVLFIEAEHGSIEPPFVLHADSLASNWVYMSNEERWSTEGFALYEFATEIVDTYHVFCRVRARDSRHNSVFVAMDSEDPKIYWSFRNEDTSHPVNWTWFQLTSSYGLDPGQHVFGVYTREDSTDIDALVITNQLLSNQDLDSLLTIPDVDPVDTTVVPDSIPQVGLTWTAPSENHTGIEKPCASYDIRFSSVPIGGDTLTWWETASQVVDEPTPSAPGTAETHTVRGLLFEVEYKFLLKSYDEVGNESAFSNVAVITRQ